MRQRFALHTFLLVLLFFSIVPAWATSAIEQADLVRVDKAKRALLLPSHGKILRQYQVALGPNPIGPKERQGDGRTPEGIYYIASRNPQSAYHRSLRISYPNQADRARAHKLGVSPGGDIMIHGITNGRGWIGAAHRQIDWTLGCIALTNDEIEEVWRLVPDKTRVEIVP